ncbi:MAG: hypothetical protein AAB922_05900 [Patescibacteria group bacterium]
MKTVWTNATGEKFFVRVLDELHPLNMPKKCRVQKESAQSGQGIFLINKNMLEFVEKYKCDRRGVSENTPCPVCNDSGWQAVRPKT